MIYVNVVDNDGRFELIDSEFMHLYPLLDFNKLPQIDQQQYHEWARKSHCDPRWQDGKIVYATALMTTAAVFEAVKQSKYAQINAAAQAFITVAAELDKVPDFEVKTWERQAAEAEAWAANPDAPTPTLAAIAAARGVDLDELRQKALKKASQYSALTATIAGQRQAYVDRLNAAADLTAVAAIEPVYEV